MDRGPVHETHTLRPVHTQKQRQPMFMESERSLVRTLGAVEGQDGGARMGSFRRG